MTDLAMWSLLVGALLPPLIALVQQPTWSQNLRATVTALICLVVGSITSYISGDFTGRSVLSAILVTLVAAWSAYGHFWKPIGLAPAIEYGTSPRGELKPVPPASDDL